MTVAFGIDSCHLTAEEFAVGRGVMQLIHSNIIMDHLMENCILNEFFGQIKTGVDAEDKMVICPSTKRPFAMLDEGEFAKKRAGIAEFDRNRWECAAEKAGVELVKAGLYVGDGGMQDDWLLVIGYWLLVIGNWGLVIGNWGFVIRDWI